MQTQSSVQQIDEQLSAFFDDELEEGARALVETELERDEELASRLADLAFMRTMVVGDLDHQAERVPEARFEQLWDGFEESLERESRLQEAAETPPTLLNRLLGWLRPVRVPLAVAGAAALALVVVRSAITDDPSAPGEADSEVASNTQEPTASDQPDPAEPPQPEADEAEPRPKMAMAPTVEAQPDPEIEPEAFPQPELGEAQIRHIEFGGTVGTISSVEGARGTTTVIWVTDEGDSPTSERSL